MKFSSVTIQLDVSLRIVVNMTYNVFGKTLNLSQSISFMEMYCAS